MVDQASNDVLIWSIVHV